MLLLLSRFSRVRLRPHRRQPSRVFCPWDSPGKNTGEGCHFLLQCVKVKSLSHVRLFTTPWTAAHQAPLPMGFSRQEYWRGVPLPSPQETGDGLFNVINILMKLKGQGVSGASWLLALFPPSLSFPPEIILVFWEVCYICM